MRWSIGWECVFWLHTGGALLVAQLRCHDDDRDASARATSPNASVTVSYPQRSAPETARRTCADGLSNGSPAPQGQYKAHRSLCIMLGPTACRPLLAQDGDQQGCSTEYTFATNARAPRTARKVRNGALVRAFLHARHAAATPPPRAAPATTTSAAPERARRTQLALHRPPARGDPPPPLPRPRVLMRARDQAPRRPASRRRFVCAARPSVFPVGPTLRVPWRGATPCSCAAADGRLSNRRGRLPDRGHRRRGADALARSPRPAAPPPRATPVLPASATPACA